MRDIIVDEYRLKPCPFCGGNHIDFGYAEAMDFIMCKECGASVSSTKAHGYEELAQAWNQRKRSEVLTERMLDAVENPLQELDNMADPLEPIKVVSAMKSEAMKMEMRKEKAPESISILDYTIYAALWKRIPYELGIDEQGEFVCPTCGTWIYSGEEPIEKRKKLYQPYCQNCGQRLSYLAEGEKDVEKSD